MMFEEDTLVEVKFPLNREEESGSRENWSWLPGVVITCCGDNEYQILVEDERLRDKDMTYPVCFRDPTEIRSPVLK